MHFQLSKKKISFIKKCSFYIKTGFIEKLELTFLPVLCTLKINYLSFLVVK